MGWHRNLTKREKVALRYMVDHNLGGYVSTTRKPSLLKRSQIVFSYGLGAVMKIDVALIMAEGATVRDTPLMHVQPIYAVDGKVPFAFMFPVDDVRFEDIRLHPEPTKNVYKYVMNKIRLGRAGTENGPR